MLRSSKNPATRMFRRGFLRSREASAVLASLTPTNSAAIGAFHYHVSVLWHDGLGRRSQKAHVVWPRMAKLVDEFLPKPRILHPWPNARFAVRHPR